MLSLSSIVSGIFLYIFIKCWSLEYIINPHEYSESTYSDIYLMCLFLGIMLLSFLSLFNCVEKIKKNKLLIISDIFSIIISISIIFFEKASNDDEEDEEANFDPLLYYRDNNLIKYKNSLVTCLFAFQIALNSLILPFFIKEMFLIENYHFFPEFFQIFGIFLAVVLADIDSYIKWIFGICIFISFLRISLFLFFKILRNGTSEELLKENDLVGVGKIFYFSQTDNVNIENQILKFQEKLIDIAVSNNFISLVKNEKKMIGVSMFMIINLHGSLIYMLLLINPNFIYSFTFSYNYGDINGIPENFCIIIHLLVLFGYVMAHFSLQFMKYKTLFLIVNLLIFICFLIVTITEISKLFMIISYCIMFLGGFVIQIVGKISFLSLSTRSMILVLSLFWLIFTMFFILISFLGLFSIRLYILMILFSVGLIFSFISLIFILFILKE